MAKIGFLGAGNMAEAIISGIIDAKLYASNDIYLSDVRADRLAELADKYGIESVTGNCGLAKTVDILILSIKPQNMADVLDEIKDFVTSRLLIVSIAAGVRTNLIENYLGEIALVRVMPNMAALIGQAASALYANKLASDRIGEVENIFSAVGSAVTVDNEDLLDAVTAVSGSGPAYFFLLIEEMINAATKNGLEKTVAQELVIQTAKGAALLAAEKSKAGEGPDILRQKVTSPGGTTAAALEIFAKHNLSDIVAEAIDAANQRSKQLSNS